MKSVVRWPSYQQKKPSMPTVKDVAKAANCSTATVSRALAHPERVSEATRQRVAKAVAEVGYSPNAAARNLRRSESRTIMVILPDIANPFFSNIIGGLESIAHQAGYQVLLGDAGHNPDRIRSYFDLVPSNQADGIILLTSEVPAALLKAKQADTGFPLVVACEYFEGLSLPTIHVDNEQAAARATDYLVSLGHTRIATLTGPHSNPICRDRLAGFNASLASAGLECRPDWILEGDFSFQSGYDQGRRMLDGYVTRPTAVFCQNDEMAIGVIKSARDLGIAVPEQLSVVGFDDIEFSQYCEPELTTVHQPREDIGRTAMRLLLDRLKKKDVPLDQTLKTHLIVRNSTARASD